MSDNISIFVMSKTCAKINAFVNAKVEVKAVFGKILMMHEGNCNLFYVLLSIRMNFLL